VFQEGTDGRSATHFFDKSSWNGLRKGDQLQCLLLIRAPSLQLLRYDVGELASARRPSAQEQPDAVPLDQRSRLDGVIQKAVQQ
jgi:hypothetical protein